MVSTTRHRRGPPDQQVVRWAATRRSLFVARAQRI